MKKGRIMCKTAMTVENLTTFHRMQGEEIFYIYLSGYHNTDFGEGLEENDRKKIETLMARGLYRKKFYFCNSFNKAER